jgi:RsiW-degrading membrane proteinase PrsW (M82 family)
LDPSLLINLTGALIIAGVWLLYLHFLDIFRPEKWRHLVFTFILGACTPWFVIMASPILNTIGFRMNDTALNDFLFSVFGIGFIEETAKILPFLFVVFIGKIADEPVDYIIYASASALGFATMENIIYFHKFGPEIMLTRGLLSVLGHIVDTSIIAYGIVVYKFRRNKYPLIYFFWFLFLAAMLHGIYDFFIISKYFYGAGFIFTLIVWFVLIEIWSTINNNCLNNSPYFTKNKVIDSDRMQKRLLQLFSFVLFFQVLAISYSEGFVIGLQKSFSGILLNAFILVVVCVRISRFKLVPRRWKPIRLTLPFLFKITPEGYMSIQIRGESFNEVHINKHLGQSVTMVPMRAGASTLTEPVRGYVLDKIFLKDDEHFYLVDLQKPLAYRGFDHNRVLLKAKSSGMMLFSDKFPVAGLMLMPEGHVLSEKDSYKTFALLEWVYILE